MIRVNRKINAVLLSLEGVGAVFVAVFLAAYLGGLPTSKVLHDEPAFRIPLTVFGIILLVLIFAASVLAVRYRKN